LPHVHEGAVGVMAGHRKAKGRTTQHEARQARMARRVAAAATLEERASAAFDWLRMSCSYSPDKAAASAVMQDAAAYLERAARDAGRRD
jgi:transglutaminase-like putative cysteine protease